MEGGRQLRLLLWKDYLIRKRKVITLAGVIWASAVIFSLHIVRVNVDNEVYPTCGFPARALPSAGMLPFMQSFMCTINNECSPLDQYDEIPSYENSKLTQLTRRLGPILNESTLDVASSVPDALKLLATLADVVDEPAFVEISKNGLHVKDLFTKPSRAKRYIADNLELDNSVTDSVMEAEIGFQGLLNGSISSCNSESLSKTLIVKNNTHLSVFVEKLCSKSMEKLQKMFVELLFEVNYSKYMTMLGDMYYKLSGDNRIITMGDMLTAVLRMINIQSFLPPELVSVVKGTDADFSYMQLSLIPKLMDKFEPTFRDTQSYEQIRGFADTIVFGLQYLDKLFVKIRKNSEREGKELVGSNTGVSDTKGGLQAISNVLHHATDVLDEAREKDASLDTFNALSQIMNFITKFVSPSTKHDILFYSTLLGKLLESAYKVIDINMHIEQLTYNVTLRHPAAVELMKGMTPEVIGKAFEALADPERAQILTSKINAPGRMFCDAKLLKSFFQLSKPEDAESLKKKLCSDVWKNYVADMIESFGVFQVKNNINRMASLLIQETLGKDTSEQLYTIDHDFKILRNFTQALMGMNTEVKAEVDWRKLFDLDPNSEFMKVVEEKGHLGKQMLIVVHGALAKEIVQQNAILDFKISPFLDKVITLTSGIIEQLDLTPRDLATKIKDNYYDIVMTVLMTAISEDKTYKALSTPGLEVMCNGIDNAGEYLILPTDVAKATAVVEALCNATIAIDIGLQADSAVAKSIRTIATSSGSILGIDWNQLITNLKNLYIRLEYDYPYVFEFQHYGMDKEMRGQVDLLFTEAKEYWFGVRNLERSLHLSVKLALRFLDLLDHGLFGIQSEYWLKIKHAIVTTTGPIDIFDQSVQLITALLTNNTYEGDLPPTTVIALGNIVPNIPQLTVDAIDIIVKNDTDIQPIIAVLNADPPWPCSDNSLSELLTLSPSSVDAVRSLETIFCMNREFQEEWVEYLNMKNATNTGVFWNRTDYPPHLFLKLSSNFDSLVHDVVLTRDALNHIFKNSSDGSLGLKEAWNYAVQALNVTNRHVILKELFTKIDSVLNSVNISSIPPGVSSSRLWEGFVRCSRDYIDDDCRMLGRKAWKYFFGSLSVILENIAADLLTYFKEVNEPQSNFLQLVGFTRNTGLYMLYDKMPAFVGVLLNSYWDYGFMKQIRRATLSQFWDCEAVVDALVPPPGSTIDFTIINKVQPFVCPSLLHWLSLPRGENTLLDVFAKPQYFFYTLQVQNITSRYENAYTKAVELADYITEISKKNKTILSEEDIKMNSIEGKLKTIVDKVFLYKIDKTDANYTQFNDINYKQFTAHIYLTRIVTIVNKLQENIIKIDAKDLNQGTDEELKMLKADLDVIKYLFKRRPVDAIIIHFDVLTDVLQNNRTLLESFDNMCKGIQMNASRTILGDNLKAAGQVCSRKYEVIYKTVQDLIVDDYEDAKKSLDNLVDVLSNGEGGDLFELLSNRKQLRSSLKNTISHSDELGTPVYLKYLQSNIQGYGIIVSFLAGDDWWKDTRAVYNGPYANKFFTYLENSFEIAEDLLTNFDRIHIVRLLRDINLNETESFCQPNITLSDYLPDSTGMFSELKNQLCNTDKLELYKEIPPLLFAAQGYENSLRINNEVDYPALYADISKIESRLELIKSGPNTPLPPPWVTEEKLQHLKKVALELMSKQSLTKMAFAVLSNGVDAGTLFLNSSQCTVCSQLTTWLKQLNLQLFKKQEYDNLLCHLQTMSLDDVHQTLKNDFHWDMAIRELISTRNYTKYEMNKSLSKFLDHVRLYLVEDISANTTKLTDCLAKNISRNELGNATLFASVLSHTGKLLRAELPHIHQVEGIKDMPYLKQLSTQIAHNLDINRPLKDYLVDNNGLHGELMKVLNHDVVNDIERGQVNLRKVRSLPDNLNHITLPTNNWQNICEKYNCSEIATIIIKNINTTAVDKMLPQYQQEEFWRFHFVTNIVEHAEGLVSHGARLLGVASKVDLAGVMKGRVDALIDTGLLLINEDILDSVLYSLHGIISQLRPVLNGTSLDHDLEALSSGLNVLRQLKNYLIEEVDLKLQVSHLFPNPDNVEAGLLALGINNTNFWSLAAPRIHGGHILLKPLLTSKQDSHISQYICQLDPMSRVLDPSDLDVVTADDVFAAVVEQFCGLPDDTVKEILTVLIRNFNFNSVVDKIKATLLNKLYATSNLTADEGSAVLSKYQEMAALMPVMQDNVGYVSDLLASEPMFQSLREFSSVGNLLSSSEFLSSAGNIMCGKPFVMNTNKFYKQIAETDDLSTAPDQAQLDVLPTDFCRSLYLDIISVGGGKIVWSFVKPLIMGKILYTPPNPTVQRIMEKANATFSTMIKMTNLVHSFAASFSSVEKLSSHRAGIEVLRSVMTNPQFSSIRAMIIGADDAPAQEFNVDGVFDEFGDLQSVGSLLSKASDLLHCINLDRFKATPNEDELTHQAAKLSIVNEFSAGVVFLNSEEQDQGLTNVEYKIRMDIDNAPTTKRLKDFLWIPGPESSFIENMRYFRGFVQIQDIVDKAIIQLSADALNPQQQLDWAVYTQQTPYPCYTKDFFQTSLYESQSLIVAFFFALLFTVASTVRFIVSDKETGNTMLMSVMGVDLRWHTLSWFIASFLEMLVTMLCITIILYAGNILPTTDPSLVFALLFIFGLSVLSFCYMISKLFESASLAAVCGAITYLVTFMPFVIILSLEAVLYSTLKLFICLSMSSSLCYAFLYIARYEARGAGAGWAQLWHAPGGDDDHMSIGLAALMMLIDAAIYFAIGWTIDRYFGIKTLKSNITQCTTTDEKAGVSVVNVSKVYHEGTRRAKLALDNVSVELHKGQITTLLGHNGAGKTTLINILTGMLRPSRGHVSLRSERGAARLGVCPQRDVLLAPLSAREHVALYAQLKSGLTAHEVRDEVDKMLQVLSLGSVSSEPVGRLSGGTRRRLCVALAFIGRPHLVSLDEPTAGVDPAARRDIWSMIVKLKEDRTILMTTHHLDEAELLSDQIVIMHKGQIHTSGSPIEIKRTLGNGYKLTVMYPEIPDPEETLEDMSQEEKTKQLVTVVRDVVKNANVIDVNGLEVEIGLPFFDANGLNNNFYQLCSVLEATQSALGFKSYTMDCSSLEQVFFNVCQQADTPINAIEYVSESPSKSTSSSSIRTDRAPQQLVPPEGPLRGTAAQQFRALMYARYLHHIRNKWLLFMLIILPSLFVTIAMGFSMLRPPADNEISLKLDKDLYINTTDFIVPQPSMYSSDVDPSLAQRVMSYLMDDRHTRNWTTAESPVCECAARRQVCDIQDHHTALPDMMVLPDVDTLNKWLVDTQEIYIEKRYGGYSSSLKHNTTRLVAWYNNKGHHAMVSHLNALNSAVLRAVVNIPRANITTYTHPLKISKEQISKATVYQHIADAGISGLVLVAYALISAGAAIYLVSSRRSQEKRLQLLCGVTPMLYWTTALVWDMMIMAINMGITAAVMSAFGFPVFVARNNLPAICILFLLYGYACGCMVHVAEKLFSEASMANMVLFCGNAFLGLSFIAILLIFDIISESEATDNARYILHKIFMLSPQFALGDGLLEIAKNTIQAQVLGRFGMDTYKDPLASSLVVLHYSYLAVVGTALLLFNLALEYDCFQALINRFRSEHIPPPSPGELEPLEVSEERKRVHAARLHAGHAPLRVNTIGNINRGFVHTEGSKNSMQRVVVPLSDAAQCVSLSKVYRAVRGKRLALRNLTLGIPPRQCTALLGQNGAGKSTTFAMLTGEVRPSSGQLYLNNKLVNSTQLCTGLISYCPQSDAIDPLLTVTETLRFYCRLRGISDHEQVVKRTIDMFELGRYSSVRSGALSGGNKRKLCAAIAFMARTPLVLLDEPTSGMDPVSRGCVSRGVMAARAGARGVLLSTHALDDARRLAARVALLRAGQLVALNTLDHCLSRFGGGYIVQCRVSRVPARAAWRRLQARAPHAALRVLHQHTLHALIPTHATVNNKEVTTRLSDIFRLMAELQATCDIEDYTVNQSSLEQMFLSFTDNASEMTDTDIEPLPTLEKIPPSIPDIPAHPDIPIHPDIPSHPDIPIHSDIPAYPDISTVPDNPDIPDISRHDDVDTVTAL
ncbi:lipid droplet defective isoform X2 [Anticarsia gemmatalis]|uniref:lipid droplet defective isoform X2 n=1 Tax=Anticarsia gemmatalis TaxID=129554 RepID=UPI003F76300A